MYRTDGRIHIAMIMVVAALVFAVVGALGFEAAIQRRILAPPHLDMWVGPVHIRQLPRSGQTRTGWTPRRLPRCRSCGRLRAELPDLPNLCRIGEGAGHNGNARPDRLPRALDHVYTYSSASWDHGSRFG
jgi:hypothetical protein